MFKEVRNEIDAGTGDYFADTDDGRNDIETDEFEAIDWNDIIDF